MKNPFKLIKPRIWIISGLIIIAVFSFKFSSHVIEISSLNPKKEFSYSDQKCLGQRPMAIMLASDPIARPLSGISEADIVFEMPVNQDGVTRMMAVFKCKLPDHIGSIRSARKDFIPLAAALDAIFVHWGGEKRALLELDAGILDNVDGLKYEERYFYRVKDIPRPHNGFSNPRLLVAAVEDFGYRKNVDTLNERRMRINQNGPRKEKDLTKNWAEADTLILIPYSNQFKVSWEYDPKAKTYKRFRDNIPEVDKNNDIQVETERIIVIKTSWTPVNIDYIDVTTAGSGEAEIYQSGKVSNGRWAKDPQKLARPLLIYDASGNLIQLTQTKTWIEVVFK